MRTGDATQPLTVRYTVSGDASPGKDFAPLTGTVTIPAGKTSAMIPLTPLVTADDNKVTVITITTEQNEYHVGCPSQSLIVIRK